VRKISSLVIITILIIGGFAIISRHTRADEGEYPLTVTAGDNFDSIDITVEEEDDDIIDELRDISGFTLVLLLIACLTAAGWYQQKNKEV